MAKHALSSGAQRPLAAGHRRLPFWTWTRGGDQRAAPADRLSWLMRRAQTGDKHAYRLLLFACADWLHARPCMARFSDPDAAVQRVLQAVHDKRHCCDPDQPVLPWLAAIAAYKLGVAVDELGSLRGDP